MYSLIMMTAMTTAPSGPEFNGYFRNLFHPGNCTGQSQSASCNGCCGGAPFGSRLRAFFSFGGGCCGGTTAKSSCTGSGYSCCGGSGYSCCGGGMAYSCSGSSAASFSCNGSLPPGAIPMEGGSPYATPLPAAYYYPPIVNTYSYPPTMIAPTITPVVTVPTVPAADPTGVAMRTEAKNQLPLPAGPVANKATVVVKLPADAKLFAESQLLELTTAERTFYTPDLPAGREYAYHFKIEYTRNGRTVSETQKINVMAGRTSTVLFDDLTLTARPTGNTAVVAKPEEPAKPVSAEKSKLVEASSPAVAKITVKVPANGTLYIDGKKNDKTGTERQFTTPPLPGGKEFSYAMKLELTRNGQQEEVTQKVVFQAGEIVTVDFTDVAGDRRVGK